VQLVLLRALIIFMSLETHYLLKKQRLHQGIGRNGLNSDAILLRLKC